MTTTLSQADAERRKWREMKRLLHEGLNPKTDVGLVKAANSGSRRLPDIALKRTRDRRELRGLFLEGLGVAILPQLDKEQERHLVEAGALVVKNERVGLEFPDAQKSSDIASATLWHRAAIDLDMAHRRGSSGKCVRIGILDSGIDPYHPEFEGKSIFFRAFSGSGAAMKSSDARDFHWHGTHVAGICSGKTIGVAPQADLSVAAVLTYKNDKGGVFGYLAQILHGLNWLFQDAGTGYGVSIINMSLGMNSVDESELRSLYDLCMRCRDVGTLLVAAIGNSGDKGEGHHGYPARFDNVLGVGAIGRDGSVAEFSDWGLAYKCTEPVEATKPDICAPGVEIYSAVPGGGYEHKSGTSMAAPIVSGVAALLVEQEPDPVDDPHKIVEKLFKWTKKLTESDHNRPERTGIGVISLADF